MRKICVVTGTRAEYGHLFWVMKEIEKTRGLKLQIIATGMHLSPEFGLTYREVEKDFDIDKKIEMLLSSDSQIGISKAMGLAQISFAEAFEELRPDIVVVLGDRFEIFSAASAAMVARIPIAHIHGGESTEGAFDEAIRHSVTKMSHLHFVATEEYKNRVVQLGEDPRRVFKTGTPGLDNIQKLPILSKEKFERAVGLRLGPKNILVTFHPVTLEKQSAKAQFQSLLNVIDRLKETKIIFTKANADMEGRVINRMIDDYVARNGDKACAHDSLGQLRYLSALRYVDAVVGNSSSGLTEAPSVKIGAINIGDRQKGRVRADSVIDCDPSEASITAAFEKLYSPGFSKVLRKVVNPYGGPGASKKIVKVLASFPLRDVLKKKFFDI
ncbi:MAG: UDP-N-acetylglucosamine 2-epimerase (hydrolyzing) [Nitrospinae bacterium]|nr:UDP-N-acetylglucosamine 2-epimerase (hydrolyzing) [Nitrospinota bacterium]